MSSRPWLRPRTSRVGHDPVAGAGVPEHRVAVGDPEPGAHDPPVGRRAAAPPSCCRRPSPPRAPPAPARRGGVVRPGRNPTAPPWSFTAHHRSSSDSRVSSSNQSCASTRGARSTVDGVWPSAPSSSVPDLLQPGRDRRAQRREVGRAAPDHDGQVGQPLQARARSRPGAASVARPRPCTARGQAVVEVEHLFAVLVALAAQPADPDAARGCSSPRRRRSRSRRSPSGRGSR